MVNPPHFTAGRRIPAWLSGTLLLAMLVAAGLLLVQGPWFVLVVTIPLVVVGMATSPWVALAVTSAFLVIQYPLQAAMAEGSVAIRIAGQADDALLFALPFLALARGFSRPMKFEPIRSVFVALVLGLGMGTISAWGSNAPTYPAFFDAFSLSKSFLVLFATSLCAVDPEEVLRRLRWVTAVGVALAIVGFVDLAAPWLTQNLIPIAGPIAYRGGQRCLVSVFANEGMSGWFFAAISCVPIAHYVIRRTRLDLFLAALLVMASLLSYRRKPVLGLLAALALILAMLPSNRSRFRVVVAVVFVALVTLPMVGEVMGDTFVDAWYGYVVTTDPMRVARNALYIASWEISRDWFPLGAGLGQFGGFASTIEYSSFYERYGLSRVIGLTSHHPSFVTDAFYPHILGALGWIGALAFVYALVRPQVYLASAIRDSARSDAARIVATLAFLIAIEGLVEAVVAPVYEASLSAFVVAAPTGLAIAALRRSRAPDRSTERGSMER